MISKAAKQLFTYHMILNCKTVVYHSFTLQKSWKVLLVFLCPIFSVTIILCRCKGGCRRMLHIPCYFSLFHRFEGGGGKESGILASHYLDLKDQPFSLNQTCNWFDLLLGALDCYTWIFGQKLLTPCELFQGNFS